MCTLLRRRQKIEAFNLGNCRPGSPSGPVPLVDHERLEDVDEGFSDLQAWLQLGEESEFARTCLSLVKQIRAMAESEKPYYYNIL